MTNPIRSDTAVARASRAAKRARERVRGMSEGAKLPSESAREGVAERGTRLSQVVSVTPPRTYGIGPGGCDGTECPAVAEPFHLSFFEERIPPFTAGVNPTIPYSHVLLLIRIFM